LRTLSRLVFEDMESSLPLPAPFFKFAATEALFYRGAVSIIAGPPGSGKTITALNMVHNMAVPSLYVSNDSTPFTIIKRTVSMLTGVDQSAATVVLKEAPERASSILARLGLVQFEFSSAPSLEDVARNAEAFREKYGQYPHAIFVDILMNVEHEGVSEQNYWRLMPALKEIAQETNAAVVGFHHTSEQFKGEPCPPRSAIMGKANQLPELIITCNMVDGNMFYAVVKNRNGKSDESGATCFPLPVDAARCQIEDVATTEDITFMEPIKAGTDEDWES